MEHLAEYIGLPLFSLKARTAVMRSCVSSVGVDIEGTVSFQRSILCNSGSVELLIDSKASKFMLRSLSADEDDETASTVSSSADDSSTTSLGSCNTVSFANPLVTAVYTRPATTLEEKRALHYTYNDFKQFRREYVMRKKTCRVRFPPSSVVTDVHEYQAPENTESLYYNQSDLQRFLDEFVASLNDGCR